MNKDKRLFGDKWRWIVSVTQNPNHPCYYQYGGQGIESHWVKGEYQDFEDYILKKLGMPPSSEHQLCRIDKSDDWRPGNLAWMLPVERSNSHTKQNKYVKYKSRSLTMSSWSKELKIPYYTIRRRLATGHAIKDIVKEFKNASKIVS